jgi:hypothetical protein
MTSKEFLKLRAVSEKTPRQLSFIDGVLSLFPGHIEGDFETLASELEAAGLRLDRNGPNKGGWPVYGYVSMSLPGVNEGAVHEAVKHGIETGDWTVYDAIISKEQKAEDKPTVKQSLPVQNPVPSNPQAGYLARMQALKEKMKKPIA